MSLEDKQEEFTVPAWSMGQIKAAIPVRLFQTSTLRSATALLRDIAMMLALGWSVAILDTQIPRLVPRLGDTNVLPNIVRAGIWAAYWWFQSLTMTGIWIIGHDCGHGAFSSSRLLSDTVGLIAHTFLWTPYYSWKFSHQLHHRYHGLEDKDQHWVPKTRSEVQTVHGEHDDDFWEKFADTPLVTLTKLIFQQLLGFPLYLMFNVSGQKDYPIWTSHFNPYSVLFNARRRKWIIISDVTLLAMAYAIVQSMAHFGRWNIIRLYIVPCLLVSHWITMIVLLQHTDPRVPHYRNGAWTYTRGALATVDRPFLGWQGRFFLHDIAHYHTVHHLFPKMPFYNTEEATDHLKALIGGDYQYSEEPAFIALWNSMHLCYFVEDEGDVLFYKDKRGQARRTVADDK